MKERGMADTYFVPTRSSQALNRSTHDVIYHSEEKKEEKTGKIKEKNVNRCGEELDMKQARFEIYKFAQTGLSNIEKQKNQKELALKLGAVPMKNKAVNYKEYKSNQIKLKEKEKKAASLARLGFIHRPKRNFKNSSRNPKAKLSKKMEIGTGILKKYDNVKVKNKH